MKPVTTLVIAVMASLFAYAQTSISVPKDYSFNRVIETVLLDFPNNLRAISGELRFAMAGMENYASLINLPGAEECVVARYHSAEDTTASWQAIVGREEDFKKASARYKALYKQVKACQLKLVDGSVVFIDGEWEPPREENKFTMSTLRLATGDRRYKEVKMDVEMIYQFPEWVININIVSKKKDSLEGYADGSGW